MAAQPKKKNVRLEEVYTFLKYIFTSSSCQRVGLFRGREDDAAGYLYTGFNDKNKDLHELQLGGFDSSKIICGSNRQSSQKWNIENSWNFKPKRICWDTHLGQHLASYNFMGLIGKKDSPWIILNPGSVSNHIKSFMFDKTEQKTLQGNVDEIIRDQRRFAGLPPYLKNIATN